MSLVVRKLVSRVSDQYTNRAAQSQKMARGLKFQITVGEGLYCLCSENKDADQLCGYREADLRLCFHICKNPVFSWRGSYYDCEVDILSYQWALFMSLRRNKQATSYFKKPNIHVGL